MLAYERIQTIIGRVIYADELAIISRTCGKSVEFFTKEESTEPWETEPEYVEVELVIDDPKLSECLENKADEMGISPDEVASRIVMEYVNRYSLEGANND